MFNLIYGLRQIFLNSLLILFLFSGRSCSAQDGAIFFIHGRVMEKVRNLPVNEELIDSTTDPVEKEKFESMRRVAQIKMARYIIKK